MSGQPVLSLEIDYARLAEAIAKRLNPSSSSAPAPAEEYWSTKEI